MAEKQAYVSHGGRNVLVSFTNYESLIRITEAEFRLESDFYLEYEEDGLWIVICDEDDVEDITPNSNVRVVLESISRRGGNNTVFGGAATYQGKAQYVRGIFLRTNHENRCTVSAPAVLTAIGGAAAYHGNAQYMDDNVSGTSGIKNPDEDPQEHIHEVDNVPPKQNDDLSQPEPNGPEKSKKTIRSIDPQIKTHNDSAQSSDRLNRLMYAKAIAQEIKDAQPQMTIGILANWGSGKTQLLWQIKDALRGPKRKESKLREKNTWLRKNCLPCLPCCALVFVVLIFTVIAFGASYVNNPRMTVSYEHNSSETNQICKTTTEQHGLGADLLENFAGLLLRILLFLIFFGIIGKFCFEKWIVSFVVFGRIPQNEAELTDKNDDSKSNNQDERYIFVDFNAWEYAGSDNLWAAIVMNLSIAIESEFGVKSSLFRLIGFELKQKKESNKTLEVKFPSKNEVKDESVEELMQTYGFVKKCVKQTSANGEFQDVWEVEFSKQQEMKRALEALGGKNNITVEDKTTNASRSVTRSQESGNNNDRLSTFCNHVKRCFHFLKRCCCKAGSWILSILFFIFLIIFSIIVATIFESIVKKYSQDTPPIIQAGLWTLPSGSFIYLIVKLLFQSNKNKINQALKGTKTDMAKQLGFMYKVKEEVQLITEIVRCAEFVFNRKYRVVISIDDLDRVDLDKVKSVLDAVNILLSDKNSPFVCLIAVDCRIAMKSVEENMSSSLLQSNVTGYEYLKKIINLPFYLPEISDEEKKQFIHGMLAWRNETPNVKKKNKKDKPLRVTGPPTHIKEPSTSKPLDSDSHSSESEDDGSRPTTKEKITGCENQKFIKKCQEFLYNDETTLSYVDGNPRNIKRIFNILSLTLRVIQYIVRQRKSENFLQKITSADDQQQSSDDPSSFKLTKQISRDLVTWVILADQWPYSMSYILHVIEKSDKNNELQIQDNVHLSDIYENHVQHELSILSQEYKDEALMQDRNQDNFLCYLKKLKEVNKTKLDKKKVNFLKKITINLDQSYMQIVRRHSNLVTLKNNCL